MPFDAPHDATGGWKQRLGYPIHCLVVKCSRKHRMKKNWVDPVHVATGVINTFGFVHSKGGSTIVNSSIYIHHTQWEFTYVYMKSAYHLAVITTVPQQKQS